MDHGYEIDEHKRCAAKTKKLRQCSLPPLKGIDRCALHAGLARAKGKPGYGDPRALYAYRLTLEKRAGAALRAGSRA